MTTFENLFNQLAVQEEVEGTLVSELATEVAVFAVEAGINIWPLPEQQLFLKTLLKKGEKVYMLADNGGQAFMFEYQGAQEDLALIDFSALGQ